MKWHDDNRPLKQRTHPNYFCGPYWLKKVFKDFDSDSYRVLDRNLGLTYFLNSCYYHDEDYDSGKKKFTSDFKFLKRNLELVKMREEKFFSKAKRNIQAVMLFLFVALPGVSHISYYVSKKKAGKNGRI